MQAGSHERDGYRDDRVACRGTRVGSGTVPVPGRGVPLAPREPAHRRDEGWGYSRASSRMGWTSMGISSAAHGCSVTVKDPR